MSPPPWHTDKDIEVIAIINGVVSAERMVIEK
jgi:hypothetical protein